MLGRRPPWVAVAAAARLPVPLTVVQCLPVELDVLALVESETEQTAASVEVPWPAGTSSRSLAPYDQAILPVEESEWPARFHGPLVLAPSVEEAAEVDSNEEAVAGLSAKVEVCLSERLSGHSRMMLLALLPKVWTLHSLQALLRHAGGGPSSPASEESVSQCPEPRLEGMESAEAPLSRNDWGPLEPSAKD